MGWRNDCEICNGKADIAFKRLEVWSNESWRLTMSTYSAVKGLCYLEPKRHICHVTDLDGREASEFGPVLSKTTRAIKYATGSKVIYVYIFGDHIPHLHVHLAPHIDGDVYYDDVIRKDVEINDDTISPVDLKKIRSSILLFMKQESQ